MRGVFQKDIFTKPAHLHLIMKGTSRRQFLKLLAGAAALPALSLTASASSAPTSSGLKTGSRILFQGDSITDGGRSRNDDWNHVMGHGYAYLISSRLWYEYPRARYQFFNRGISGNTVENLDLRWQKDTVELQPDLLSILIGINETNAELDGRPGFTASHFETGYRMLLEKTVMALPDTRLVICEPFVLPAGRVKKNLQEWQDKLGPRQEITKRLAKDFKAIYIPFQSIFKKAEKRAPTEYWIWDGIHPMPAGHELMAREWIKAVLGH